jgi:hypothetical protein
MFNKVNVKSKSILNFEKSEARQADQRQLGPSALRLLTPETAPATIVP